VSDLAARLRARIRREGPLSFYEWMRAALYDPSDGYYCRSDRTRWGREGDYRTAPETSPLFSATFARYFAKVYKELGSPSQFVIIEGGAGSGAFARGVLTRLQAGHRAVFAATRYVIDELSDDARQRIQSEVLGFLDRVEFRALDQMTERVTGIVFSNELLDAFPVHRIRARNGSLRELCVGLNAAEEFVWVEGELTDERVAAYLDGIQLSDGQTVEVNLDAGDWIARAATVLERGFVITVDYGAERDELLQAPHRRTGTLRAFHRHQLTNDVLARPGEQDLTTTIDWTQLNDAGARAGLQTVRFEGLDRFLLGEGILDELEQQTATLSDQGEVLRLRTGAREMIMPNGLAASFQVMAQRKQ